ncbi:prolipoprotein diacylglyceryl transferase [bacterium]|nr:MAG: prolipoprotein diacylglyceryl transferase [bacterium]QQR62308.1 MAG: prolipoprotein diacylglyceryl transferase [bacterium]QQR63125.1 MAG: prolipoprotein diacylglyceryl transferase [bacterium]
MVPVLVPLFGSFAIHAYGLCIVVGFIFFVYFLLRDSRYASLYSEDFLINILVLNTLSALVGGRILYLVSEDEVIESWFDIFAFWQGGLSVLGSIMSICLTIVTVFYFYKKPVLPFLDIAATYAPLLQSVGRLGCFFAGCCHGFYFTGCCHVLYTDGNSLAPLCVPLFPSQLLSSFLLFILFLFLYFLSKKTVLQNGIFFFLYLFFASSERFFTDFFRGDRGKIYALFSFNQIISIFLMTFALVMLFYFWCFKKTGNEKS